MELTQQDYDERKARVDKGEGDDEDARLVKHYEANGFSPNADGPAQEAGPAAPSTTDGGSAADNLTVDRTGRGARRGK